MVLRLFVLTLSVQMATGFLFPSSGGGGGCCAPSCAPACSPVSSCGGGCSGGFSGYSGNGYSGNGYSGGGYSGGGYSGGSSYESYAQPQIQSSYAVAAPQPTYISAPQASYSIPSSGGYAKSSYSAPSAPISQSYNAAPSPSYSAPASYAPRASSYSSGAPIPPPPADTSSQQVSPASESYAGRAASGSKLQAVEEEEAKAELSDVASTLNSTLASEPSPPVDISLLKLTNDTECNSEELREIINQNMTENLNASKRLIQVAAEEKYGGRFDVICSVSDFSYVTNTELFCQYTNNSVSCYAYRQL